MNNYISPEIELISLGSADVITTSPGDTPALDWEW